MSQEVISQKVRRTCEGCGVKKEYDLVADDPMATSLALGEWYTINRRVVDMASGQRIDLQVQACCLACVPAAAVKLALPPESPADNIDLASLRASNLTPTN